MTDCLQSRLCEWSRTFDHWLKHHALPLWWESGADHQRGGFHEAIRHDGTVVTEPRRARVQARQSYVYAIAGTMGWDGPWQEGAAHGLAYLDAHFRKENGLYAIEANAEGHITNPAEMLYEQAFVLMASAHAARVLPARSVAYGERARALLAALQPRRLPAGGFLEHGARPYLSNPHMHLFEAMLAWFETDGDTCWLDVAREIAALSLTRFIDTDALCLREYFSADWTPAPGNDGHSVEPGHQFEWAWLLERWARIAKEARAHTLARRLFEVGLKGIDPARNVAIDEMDDGFAPRRATARLWVQTERLKAALILSEDEQGVAAAASLWRYLDTPIPGLWHDRLRVDGGFIDEPAPASSLYHITCAIQCLQEAVGNPASPTGR